MVSRRIKGKLKIDVVGEFEKDRWLIRPTLAAKRELHSLGFEPSQFASNSDVCRGSFGEKLLFVLPNKQSLSLRELSDRLEVSMTRNLDETTIRHQVHQPLMPDKAMPLVK